MSSPRPPEFDTLSLHAGQRPDPYDRRARRADLRNDLLRLQRLRPRRRPFQSRNAPVISIPASPIRRRRCLEERIAALEDGVGAVCTASGTAALHLAIATLASAGDHIVASASLYGGTINLLTQTLPRFGIRTTLVKPRDHAGFSAAMRPRDPARHRRDHRQSRPRGARHTGRREDRSRRGRSVADRQHFRHALSQPADRIGRRHRHAFADQVDRRTWPRDWRRHWSMAAASTGSPRAVTRR